jgi:hypothetical protein
MVMLFDLCTFWAAKTGRQRESRRGIRWSNAQFSRINR